MHSDFGAKFKRVMSRARYYNTAGCSAIHSISLPSKYALVFSRFNVNYIFFYRKSSRRIYYDNIIAYCYYYFEIISNLATTAEYAPNRQTMDRSRSVTYPHCPVFLTAKYTHTHTHNHISFILFSSSKKIMGPTE